MDLKQKSFCTWLNRPTCKKSNTKSSCKAQPPNQGEIFLTNTSLEINDIGKSDSKTVTKSRSDIFRLKTRSNKSLKPKTEESLLIDKRVFIRFNIEQHNYTVQNSINEIHSTNHKSPIKYLKVFCSNKQNNKF